MVRRGVLFAVCSVFLSMPSQNLLVDISDQLFETRSWLAGIKKNVVWHFNDRKEKSPMPHLHLITVSNLSLQTHKKILHSHSQLDWTFLGSWWGTRMSCNTGVSVIWLAFLFFFIPMGIKLRAEWYRSEGSQLLFYRLQIVWEKCWKLSILLLIIIMLLSTDVAEGDPDADCRSLAVQSLVLLDKSLKKQLQDPQAPTVETWLNVSNAQWHSGCVKTHTWREMRL